MEVAFKTISYGKGPPVHPFTGISDVELEEMKVGEKATILFQTSTFEPFSTERDLLYAEAFIMEAIKMQDAIHSFTGYKSKSGFLSGLAAQLGYLHGMLRKQGIPVTLIELPNAD